MMTDCKPIAKNVMTCSWCGGVVDRFEHVFKCRDCKALGDLVTGIMSGVEYSPGAEERVVDDGKADQICGS